jgi:hypothetical protein
MFTGRSRGDFGTLRDGRTVVHPRPGDAASVTVALERVHPIWFDGPTGLIVKDGLAKIVEESVMPTGLGHSRVGQFTTLGRHLM